MKQKKRTKNTKLYLFLGSLLFPLCMSGQDPSVVRMVCAGKMAVATNGSAGTSLYIPSSFLATGDGVSILQDGRTALSGSFYQDATTNVFTTNAQGWGTGSGTVAFVDNSTSVERTITTRSATNPIKDFDRSTRYVAFPNFSIETNDKITVPGRMGIDATRLLKKAGTSGILYLQSEVYTIGGIDKVYDASLRLAGSGASSTLAPVGSIVVERDISLYRIANSSDLNPANYPLFAFASPFKDTQKSGCFAGNWIRKLIPANNGHVRFVFGDYDSNGDGLIDKDQYLWNPEEKFVPGSGYLIKARPAGFDYSTLSSQGGLSITGAEVSLYDKGKFIFDGAVYGLTANSEQVFSENSLYSQTLNESPTSTINWIIGNSYTSAIDAGKLAEAITANPLIFESKVYVFPAGSTTYQPFVIGSSPIQVINLTDIPSQSIFMVRVLPGRMQSGTFSITKDMTSHGSYSHNLRSGNTFQNEVLFKVSPEGNTNIYDLTAVGIRQGAQETAENMDISKVYATNSNVFQLYSLSTDNKKLSSNVVPEGTKSLILCLSPGEYPERLTLNAGRLESIGGVWLEDLFTGKVIDLKETDSYSFDSSPKDTPERFIVHFTRQEQTGLDDVTNNFLQCYYSEGGLVVRGLKTEDMGSQITLINMQGQILIRTKVTQLPEMFIPVTLSEGVYIARLSGKRNVTVKFMKGGNQWN